jgi:hypothetical protein
MTGRDTNWHSNAVKKAAASREIIRGMHFTFPSATAVEVLAPLELDFVYLDGERGSFETPDLEASCIAAERHGMVPIAYRTATPAPSPISSTAVFAASWCRGPFPTSRPALCRPSPPLTRCPESRSPAQGRG